MLRSLVHLEMKRLLFRWQFLFSIVVVACFFYQGTEAFWPGSKSGTETDYVNYYLAFLYAAGKGPGALIAGVFPLVITLATGDSLAQDRRYGFESAVLLRTNYKNYILGKIISSSVITFLFVVVSYTVGFIYTMFNFQGVEVINNISGITPAYAQGLFLEHPLLYCLLITFNAALLGIVVALVSLFLSIFLKNSYIVIAVPWVVFFVLQFCLYALVWQHYAPLDLVGLYMLSNESYRTLEIPILWLCFIIVFGCLTYYCYFMTYKAGRKSR